MQKDFDEWNEYKKKIDTSTALPSYREGEIWWCSLGINVGSEQNGTGYGFTRPMLITRGFSRELVWAVPLTTTFKKNFYYVPLGIIRGMNSAAVISQLRIIDIRRFTFKHASIDMQKLEEVKNALRGML
jgi:mRNA interferase MazF